MPDTRLLHKGAPWVLRDIIPNRREIFPHVRCDLRIWAAAAIYTVGSVNFLFTLTNKAKLIRDVLRIGCLCSLHVDPFGP